jgi:ribosomal protein S18 acetylase RimI-like enzyme
MTSSLTTFRAATAAELTTAFEIDEDAIQLYVAIGLAITIADDHPFVLSERGRWAEAVKREDVVFANVDDVRVGFYSLDSVDAGGYLDQLAVRPAYGRRGIGRALIEHACERARAQGETQIWLTTYDEVPWNRPFYERCGFCVVGDSTCSRQLQGILAEQRAVLSNAKERVAMCRAL